MNTQHKKSIISEKKLKENSGKTKHVLYCTIAGCTFPVHQMPHKVQSSNEKH